MHTELNTIKCSIPIRTKNSWNHWMSDNAIAAMLIICQYAISCYPINPYITSTMGAMMLFNKESPTQREKECVQNAFKTLYNESLGWITPTKSDSCWCINSKNVKTYKNDKYMYVDYTYVEVIEVLKKFNKSKIQYVCTYLKIKSLFDFKYGICHFSQKKISECTGVKQDTLKKRIDQLLEKEILYAYHSATGYIDEKYIHYPNIYYLAGDFDKADKYSKIVVNTQKQSQISRD